MAPGAPAAMAPMTQAAEMSAPVLRRCTASSSVESRLYRIAAGTGAGHHSLARTPQDSSTASTRARASARYATSASSGVEVFNPDIARLIGEDLLHLCLGGGEVLARLPQTLDPLLEQLEGGVQVQLLTLQPAHDLLQALELLGAVQGVAGARHQDSVTRAPTVPSVTRRRNGSAGVNCATRFNTRPCSSRANA